MSKPKTFSVDPTGWILDSALEDYYRTVLPLGDTNRPLNELQALMEAPPGGGIRSLSIGDTAMTPLDNIVRLALWELPETHRLVIEALWGGNMSLREVERYTGIPKTTVARKRDEAPKLLGELLKRLMPTLADKYYLD